MRIRGWDGEPRKRERSFSSLQKKISKEAARAPYTPGALLQHLFTSSPNTVVFTQGTDEWRGDIYKHLTPAF